MELEFIAEILNDGERFRSERYLIYYETHDCAIANSDIKISQKYKCLIKCES